MSKVLEFELTRAQVVKAAKDAIKATRDNGYEVPTPLVRKLLKVAREAPEFAMGDWYIDGRCGCLIGNLYGETINEDELDTATSSTGLHFDNGLCDLLTAEQDAEYNEDFSTKGIVRVTS